MDPLHQKLKNLLQKLQARIKKRISTLKPGKRRWFRAILFFFKNFISDDIIGIAAETAFFLVLSVFPLLLIITSTLRQYSVDFRSEVFAYLLPGSVSEFLTGVISQVPVDSSPSIIPVVITLWSASQGIWALMKGICRAYTGNNPVRPYLKRLIAPLFVIVFVAVVGFGIAVWLIGENLLSRVDGLLSAVIFLVKYIVAFIAVSLFVLALYVNTPGYDIKKRHMVPGAAAAAAGWIFANRGFEIYISRFSNYSSLYGSVGTFLGLVLWLFIICIVILAGAEFNSTLLQSRQETQEKSK